MLKRSALPARARVVAPNGVEHFLLNGSAAHTFSYAKVVDIPGGHDRTGEPKGVQVLFPLSDFVEVSWETLEEIARTEVAARHGALVQREPVGGGHA